MALPLTRRVEGKRGHSYRLDGKPVEGVTTIIGNGVPKPALVGWAIRETATFAAHNLELLGQLRPDERIDLLRGAPYRDRDRAANRGTEVHAVAEKLLHGQAVEVPEELSGHADSYVQFLNDWQVAPVLSEAVVVSRRYRYMGTLDLICDLADGQRWLLDIKTNKSGVFPETALQLAAYRYAETYVDNGTENPVPPVDATGVVWVRADGYDLVPLKADETTFRTFLYVQQVARFQKQPREETVGDVLTLEATA